MPACRNSSSRRWRRSAPKPTPTSRFARCASCRSSGRPWPRRPRDKAEQLWTRFRAAAQAVRERVEPLRAAQHAQQVEHLARKIALCEQAEAPGRLDRLDRHRRRAQGAAGRVEDHRPGAAARRASGVGSLPHRLQPLLHAPAGRPEAAQAGVDDQPRDQGRAHRACRGAGHRHRLHRGLCRAQGAAGRVEGQRAREEGEVRAGVAEVPRGLRRVHGALSHARHASSLPIGSRAARPSRSTSRRWRRALSSGDRVARGPARTRPEHPHRLAAGRLGAARSAAHAGQPLRRRAGRGA